ncbi:MAG: hypothetical protein HQ567_35145 [Candidatus Nealsonbacteria bacterium]|nr:hypothetical protein [Candidatus Nealsonbacteria bacterium]
MSQNDRMEQIVEALEPHLREGDQFVVCRTDQQVRVDRFDENETPPLEEVHPEFYGHLLEINEELSNTGGNVFSGGLLAVVSLCVAVHMQWIDSLAQLDLEKVRSFWVYALAVGVTFWLTGMLTSAMKATVYNRRRADLLSTMRQTGLSRRTVLARIVDDENLSDVTNRLKTDRYLEQF